MKLWVLMENTACCDDFAAEHGLSLYMETGKRRILFDMGQSAAFFGCNSVASLYVSPYAFEPHFGKGGKNIGPDPALENCGRLVMAEDRDLVSGLSLHSCKELLRLRPLDPAGLCAVRDGNLMPEDFRHEQYLLIREQDRRILISGCSHKGIVDIVWWQQPDVLVGGFHLRDISPENPALEQIAATLLESPTVYYHDISVPDENVKYIDIELVKSLCSLKLLKASSFYPVILVMAQKSFTEADSRLQEGH